MSARKVMLLGEIGVGKSSLVRRLVFGRFERSYMPTVGADIYRHSVKVPAAAAPVELILWDTDGSFGNAIFSHVYIKQAAGALIVGDVMRRASLDRMLELKEGFAVAMPGRHAAYVVNKMDLLQAGEEPELPAGLRQGGVDLTLTSALTGENVGPAFERLAAAIVRRGL